MRVKVLFFQLVALSVYPGGLNAQSAQCVTVADGCDGGSSNESGISSAIARFQDGMIYGGSDAIVMSSALNGNALAMITYVCNDGSAPPKMEGSAIRSSLQKILSCPNQCGGVASPNNGDCGFGVLVANSAANADCFSKAVNVVPHGAAPTWVPSVGAFKDPVCLFDSGDARVLTDGSATGSDMTVEKCIGLAAADGYRYAGVEFGIECYWGDIQTNPQQSAQDNCNQPCSGSPGEVCGAGNRILLYENANAASLNTAKVSVDNYNGDPTNSALAQAARNAINNALSDALSFFDQITNAFVKTAQEQLIQDLTTAASTAAAAASVAAAALLAEQIAAALASEQAVQNAKNQKPTQTITEGPTSTPTQSSTSSSTSSTTSSCPLCVSCADDQNPESGDEDGQITVFDDASDFDPTDPPPSKRQVEAEEQIQEERRSRLNKRGTGIKEVTVCKTTYVSNQYSTGTNNGQYNTYGYVYKVNTNSQCVWSFNLLTWTPLLGGFPPNTQAGSYDAEHVYEAQIIAQFVKYVGDTLDTGKACRAAGYIKNILARTTEFPGRSSNVFTGGSALAEMVRNLPSDTSGNGNEMVALDKDLNILKAAVFNEATTTFSASNVAPGRLAKTTRFAMLYAYLATPAVANIFKAASLRMRATLLKLDNEIAASSMASPGFLFRDKYITWEDNFLFGQGSLVEGAMEIQINGAITQLQTNTALGSPQLRQSFVQQVQALTAPGAAAYPSDWLDLDDILRA
ncbi:hypothetical protein ABW20_dc0107327 [Dactylellina cionopaga]|nr:hypothetical protein ABW20_dc0107327 [Dactylellina cionopaga]